MNDLVSEQNCHCPYCAEPISLVVDVSAGAQRYIEDCQVCCQAMQITLDVDGDRLNRIRVDRVD